MSVSIHREKIWYGISFMNIIIQNFSVNSIYGMVVKGCIHLICSPSCILLSFPILESFEYGYFSLTQSGFRQYLDLSERRNKKNKNV